MDNHFDRRERTIYVWMLERSVTDDQLYLLFSKIGPIEKLIFKEYADGTPQHCLIVFRYVDSVLTAMSTLQGIELNGKPISLRPLRESTHAVLMPASTMYPTTSSLTKERTTTVTSSDGLSDHSDDHPYGGGAGKKQSRSNWDEASSAGSASSCAYGLESVTEKLTIDERRGGTVGARSCTSYSSISSGAGSPSHSLSPPPLPSHQQHLQHHHGHLPSAIHGSLRKPWRPSRGPIPAPLLAPGGVYRNQQQHYSKEEYGSGAGGGGGYCSHTNVAYASAATAPPPSLFSQIIPPSPGCGFSPSPYTTPHHSTSFFGGGVSAAPSPRPLFPEMYKPASSGAAQRPTGVFSPTAAPEEVLWRHQPHQAPPTPLMSPAPCTAGGGGGGRNWFDYGEYSVPQAYRGSGTEQQLAAAGTQAASPASPHPLPSLGGMLPPNSPPIGQCTRFFDFTEATATLPRLRPHPTGAYGSGAYGPHGTTGPASARPHALSPFTARCAPRAPRSAAPYGTNLAQAPPSFQHQNSPFAWPEFRSFGGRY
ncbi:hypothetical protein PENTCL1PPCAC_2992 [Pristionchus entomophagus]|uniref:RRM domain-containing protein n=1 Tax=Pristionchus entomophagus TaxID=358040 RepID=A0AAV5SBW7_9BILA|nr:hypothetical protein PENTCL1PPCAC_2992 [Pristionchus entomophagus]